jgi:hypothetical protein
VKTEINTKQMTTSEQISLLLKLIRYNLKVVFANKFIYFLIAAVLFYLVIIGIMLFSDFTNDAADVYATLLFPGILIIFYPVVYNIQNDKDARMLEIIFGVPDYRYKVYLFRLILAIIILALSLVALTWFASISVAYVPVFEMVYQLLFPLGLIACLTFLFSSLIRNGNGTAAVMVIIGLVFWFLSEPLAESKWNLFLNPFRQSGQINQTVWDTIIQQNRIILGIGMIISILWGMLNLQKREKFV